MLIPVLAAWACSPGVAPLPEIQVTADDVRITESCRVVVPAGTVIADTNGDGVIHVDADNITVEFVEGSELRGARAGTPWDQLSGTGIRIHKHSGVTVKGARVHGYKAGISATAADGLVIEGGDLSDNYRQHLKSTPAAEVGSDWLFPHDNDKNEWLSQHGAAICIEDSSKVSVSGVLVRRTQNGIVLDRVNDSKIFDNDCSFLSGWGLAMWRSSRNIVSRNAFDFCVRGYSHGVYNRGQDAAGILCFEQCTFNVFAENSVTHGGDGFFGFAGKEAIGESPAPYPEFRYERRGCNDNILVGNDFSYAVAHGIEMTFSQGNRFVENRLVECGICGIWGGYSSGTVISKNIIERNGEMAYGLERGGVNIEHGSNNFIIDNTFRDNSCAVHLWWDDDGELLKKPGVAANGHVVTGNVIARNTFNRDKICLQLRDTGAGHLTDNFFVANTPTDVGKAVEAPRGAEPRLEGANPAVLPPKFEAIGKARPVGARAALAGRKNIIMDEWGPWDHQSPSARFRGGSGGAVEFEIFGLAGWDGAASAVGSVRSERVGNGQDFSFEVATSPAARIGVVPGSPTVVTLIGDGGVWSYDVTARRPSEPDRRWKGTVVSAAWDVVVFPWTKETDPRENLDAWRRAADGPDAVRARLSALDCRFASRGPRDLKWSEEVSKRGPGSDHFGLRATARVAFPAGDWRVRTTSDDGIRVMVDGKAVIERWDWHAPTQDAGIFHSTGDPVTAEVEYFEIDGYAILQLEFEPAQAVPPAP